MGRSSTHAGVLVVALVVGCGARTSLAIDEATSGGVPTPTALFDENDRGCPAPQPIESAPSIMSSAQFGEAIAVVELFYQDECTGAGGQYILAREVDGFRSFWIGAHACRLLRDPLPPSPGFGVVRYNQTAGIFEIDGGVCIGFPDRAPGASTDVTTRAIAVFATLADARAYAAALPP